MIFCFLVLGKGGELDTMVKDGNKESSVDNSFLEPGSIQQNLNLFQSQTIQRSGEKSVMDMEGRGYSDFYRNSSEELFLKSLMESSIGMPIPTMEMLGFKNLNQNFRTDSEELFKSWLTNGEASNFCYSCVLQFMMKF